MCVEDRRVFRTEVCSTEVFVEDVKNCSTEVFLENAKNCSTEVFVESVKNCSRLCPKPLANFLGFAGVEK